MTEDIWAQRPKPQVLELWGAGGDEEYAAYDIDDMDAWLEKLRAETRRAMEWMACIDALNLTYGIAEIMSWKEKAKILDGLVEMGVVSVYDDRHWSTDYAKLKEKAQDLDECEKRVIVIFKELGKSNDRLEAVKRHLGLHPAHTPIKIWTFGDTEIKQEHSEYIDWYKKLIEILEAEE